MITITDTITDTTVTVAYADEVADAIRPWYPEAPAQVTDAIAALQETLMRGEYTDDLAAFLAVSVDRRTDPLLDSEGVARVLGIAVGSVARYRTRGDLPEPDVMLGRSPGWYEATIRDWQAGRPGRTGRPRKSP